MLVGNGKVVAKDMGKELRGNNSICMTLAESFDVRREKRTRAIPHESVLQLLPFVLQLQPDRHNVILDFCHLFEVRLGAIHYVSAIIKANNGYGTHNLTCLLPLCVLCALILSLSLGQRTLNFVCGITLFSPFLNIHHSVPLSSSSAHLFIFPNTLGCLSFFLATNATSLSSHFLMLTFSFSDSGGSWPSNVGSIASSIVLTGRGLILVTGISR